MKLVAESRLRSQKYRTTASLNSSWVGRKGEQLPASFFLAPVSQWSELAPRDIHPTVSLGCGPSSQLPEILWVQLLGEVHWRKPPTLADTTLTICMSYFMAEDPDKELKTNKPATPQLEDFRKGQKEMPGVRPPPRILLAGIHLGWAQGRTLSQNNWPKTTWKLILSPLNLRLQAVWQSSSPGFPNPPVFRLVPLPNKASCFVCMCVSLDNSFPGVRQKPTVEPWKGFCCLQYSQLRSGSRNHRGTLRWVSGWPCWSGLPSGGGWGPRQCSLGLTARGMAWDTAETTASEEKGEELQPWGQRGPSWSGVHNVPPWF